MTINTMHISLHTLIVASSLNLKLVHVPEGDLKEIEKDSPSLATYEANLLLNSA